MRSFADFHVQRSTSAALTLTNLLGTIPAVAEKPKSEVMSEPLRSSGRCPP